MCKPRTVNKVSSDVSIVSNTSVVDYIGIMIVRSVSTVSKVSIVCRRKKKECEHNKKKEVTPVTSTFLRTRQNFILFAIIRMLQLFIWN